MGWLKKDGDKFSLGPNLHQDFKYEEIPNLNIEKDWVDLQDGEGNPVFWIVVNNYLFLSMSCGWRFVNLNNAFRKVVGNPTRTLHIYSNVGGSSVVGNQVTDLLREIKFERTGKGINYFEPLHIQYLPLRNETINIIETQAAETSGDLTKFGEGNTIVTLHFKRI